MSKKDENKVEKAVSEQQGDLKHYMQREVEVLRDILGSIQQERQCILMNDTEALKSITSQRDQQIERLAEVRELRIVSVKNLAQSMGLKVSANEKYGSPEELSQLLNDESSDSCEILSLRDTTIVLLNKINDHTASNNYLLESKITLTKKLIGNLGPKEDHPTYASNGGMSNKVKTKTMTLINHEV
ncbi:hypothetical protein SCG7109_AB_00550 [Chlamydiales bacterium SCGC AG-110-M15]|nr:hypothetical protein SCG7109_AB_00550 [Chlamydiales bacterium SCGC AG-110-M15]